MRASVLSPVVAVVAAASLAVAGCGGGGGSSTANKGAPLSKSAFCSAAKKYEQDGHDMGNDNSLAEAKSAMPKLLADAKAMTPAPAGLQSSMEKVISDLTQVNDWVQKQTSNQAVSGNNAPANVKAALADLDKHPQVKAWLKKNCPGVVTNSGSGGGASGGGGSSGAGGGAGNS